MNTHIVPFLPMLQPARVGPGSCAIVCVLGNRSGGTLQVSFMSIMFLALGAMPQLNAVTMSKPVFFKQRDSLFFAPCALFTVLRSYL